MTDVEMIGEGRRIAGRAMDADERGALPGYLAGLTDDERTALAAYRDHEIARALAVVESSCRGAEIRRAVAEQIYSELVAVEIRAQLEGRKP